MSYYKRLTKQAGWHKDIDLKDELGYSYIYQRLAEWENKIEQGTLIELPCKVGDMVWVINNYGFNRYVKESVIITGFNIVPIENNRVYPVDNYGGVYSEIFLTREEAEKRLLELQGETKL